MKILALCGKGRTGKTKTINLLVELLKNNAAKILYEERAGREHEDKRYIIEYKGKIFGITTRGDDEPSLKEDFAWFKKHSQIDYIICATRSKGKTCDFVMKQASSKDTFWFSKIAFRDCYISNENCSPKVKEQQNIFNSQQAADLLYIINNFFFA